MNSTLKVLVPIVLLVAVVFAVTFFSQNVPTEPEKTTRPGGGEPPLRFFTSTRGWEPLPTAGELEEGRRVSLQNLLFPPAFEPGETQRATTFWFENRNPTPVTMRLTYVGCTACTGGRLAPIPPEKTRALLQTDVAVLASLMPQGLVAGTPVAAVGPAADLLTSLPWSSYEFSEKDKVVFHVPPGTADPWAPQWGVLELNFKVRPGARNPLEAVFASQVDGTDQAGTDTFKIYYQIASPFEVDTQVLDLGEVTETGQGRQLEREFVVYSMTRDPLPEPAVRVDAVPGEPGEFVTAGKPVPLTGPDLERFAEELGRKANAPRALPVRSAVRVPVVVHTRVGDARLPIGPLNRNIWVTTVGGTDQKQIVLRGTVRGPVYTSDGKELDLGEFKVDQGATSRFELTTDRPDLELRVVREECRPKSLKVEDPERLPDRGGRGFYRLTVTVPKDEPIGQLAGVVVLEVKGPNPQRVRLPLRGRCTR